MKQNRDDLGHKLGWKIAQIACIGKNRTLGLHNQMVWSLPEDLKRFRQITTAHPIIMGRKTFQSMGRALPHRQNIVISRSKDFDPGDGSVWVVTSVEEAFRKLGAPHHRGEEAFITGGGEIFSQTLPITDRIYLTVIDKNYEGDAFYPEIPLEEFEVRSRERHTSEQGPNAGQPLPFEYILYERI